ncbi:MAG: helix-turn-helix domain-containing protein [Bacteroidales bacterium]|nr:helix-turn-helix domain-containing protein [Bacteroidales bacterium]
MDFKNQSNQKNQEDHGSDELSFNDVPKAVAHLINKVEHIETLLNAKQPQTQESDCWLNLDDLCKYHPDHPAKPTVYAWIGQRLIPYHKKGKKLMFLKSEIDSWLKEGRRKTATEIQAEAEQFVLSNKRGGLR